MSYVTAAPKDPLHTNTTFQLQAVFASPDPLYASHGDTQRSSYNKVLLQNSPGSTAGVHAPDHLWHTALLPQALSSKFNVKYYRVGGRPPKGNLPQRQIWCEVKMKRRQLPGEGAAALATRSPEIHTHCAVQNGPEGRKRE